MQPAVSLEPGLQPAGREPAPGPLALVQAFVNSNYDLAQDPPGRDLWAAPDALARWLRGRGLLVPGDKVGAADLKRALEVRETLRALMVANTDGSVATDLWRRLRRAVPRPGLRVEYDQSGASLLKPPQRGIAGALELVVALVYAAVEDGTWRRMKSCREHDCRWAFYDHSRNRGSSWCSMTICGSRAKVREYRSRRRGW